MILIIGFNKQQEDFLSQEYGEYITSGTYPKRADIRALIRNNPILSNKNDSKIISWL